ncbi:MAG TPA: hypothetical protein VEH27_18750 [Methylomirabilota bacterium]|nr:hypothetical protein [Methylomirabilota bacterium]
MIFEQSKQSAQGRVSGRVMMGVLLVGVGLWFSTHGLPRFAQGVSPTAPRALAELEALMKATAPATNAVEFPELSINDKEDGFTITLSRDSETEAQLTGHTIHELSPTGKVTLGETVVTFRGVGVALPPAEFKTRQAGGVPARYYDRELKPMPDEELKKWIPNEWERNIYVRGFSPGYNFRFETEKGDSLKILRGEVRDARTGSRLTSGYSSGGAPGGFQFGPAVGAWHQTPVLVMVDVAYGPVEVIEIEPKAGVEVEHPFGKLRVAAFRDGKSDSFSSGTRTQPDGRVVYEYNFERSTKDPGCEVIFQCVPTTQSLPLEIDFIGENGNTLQRHGMSSHGALLTCSVAEAASALKKIRITKRSQIGRIILRLPELPGLPEANRNISNLLKVQAPVVHFNAEWEMRMFVQHATEASISMRSGPPPPPPGYFPRTVTNATPASVLEELRVLHSKPTRIVVDAAKNEIQFRDPLLKELWERFWPF